MCKEMFIRLQHGSGWKNVVCITDTFSKAHPFHKAEAFCITTLPQKKNLSNFLFTWISREQQKLEKE
jgi:hypothetical protein